MLTFLGFIAVLIVPVPTLTEGAHNLEGSPTSVQETINVAKVTYHSGFNPTTMENDLALLKLEKSITSSDKVNTVCLPKSRTDQLSAGTYCYLTGWGRTASTGGAATVLQQALLPVVDYTTCNSRNHVLGKIFKESMLCAGGNRKGGCQGDNGGPLVCKENGKWVLRGAVSWGHPSCQTDYYSVFTRVSNNMEWIKKKLSR